MSHLDSLASSALSGTSNMSSLIHLSNNTSSSSAPRSEESDDEIIYNISEAPSLSADESDSDDDFVILSRPRSQRGSPEIQSSLSNHDDDARVDTSGITDLVHGFADFSVTPTLGRRRRKGKPAQTTAVFVGDTKNKKKKLKKKKSQSSPADAVASSSPGPSSHSRHAASTTLVVPEKQIVAKSKPKKVKKEKSSELGGRSPEDGVSDKFSGHGKSDLGSPLMYEEAFGFITSFLANPAARQDSACRLTLLQALIIELGLAKSSLPCSLGAAKAYLKSRAFLNINEYIAVRDQGPAAIQRIMYPSRTALIKEIRKHKSRAPRGWVKDMGLQVLLVECHH